MLAVNWNGDNTESIVEPRKVRPVCWLVFWALCQQTGRQSASSNPERRPLSEQRRTRIRSHTPARLSQKVGRSRAVYTHEFFNSPMQSVTAYVRIHRFATHWVQLNIFMKINNLSGVLQAICSVERSVAKSTDTGGAQYQYAALPSLISLVTVWMYWQTFRDPLWRHQAVWVSRIKLGLGSQKFLFLLWHNDTILLISHRILAYPWS